MARMPLPYFLTPNEISELVDVAFPFHPETVQQNTRLPRSDSVILEELANNFIHMANGEDSQIFSPEEIRDILMRYSGVFMQLDNFAGSPQTSPRPPPEIKCAIKLYDGAPTNNECPICLEEFCAEEMTAVFECAHCLHQECFEKARECISANGPKCPICRKEIC